MDFTPGDGPQHVWALERANHVRSARATAKRRIASGELTAADNDWWTIYDLDVFCTD